jgi:hypothetical protein
VSHIKLIRSVPGRDQMTAAEIRDYLFTPDPKAKPEAQATYSTNGLVVEFRKTEAAPVQLVEEMVATMRGIGLNEMANTLASRGIDFSSPEIPTLLAALAGSNAEVFTEARQQVLLNLGIDRRTPAQRFGVAEELTLEQVETAIEAEATDTWFGAMVEVVRGGLHSGEIVSQADVLAAMEDE